MTLRPRWSKVCFAPPSLQRAALPPPVRLHAHSPRLWSLPAFCGLAACDDLWKTLGCCIFFINTGQKILFSIENRIFFFTYFSSMCEGMKQSGRMLLPLREIRLAYRANNACYTVIIFSHSIYSSANSDSTREGLQIYPISICPKSVMGTLTKARRRSSCVR